MPTEADTCRKFVVPKLQAAGWDNEPYSLAEQRTITDGRIVPVGKGFIRRAPKRVDYLLRYTRNAIEVPDQLREEVVGVELLDDRLQERARPGEPHRA